MTTENSLFPEIKPFNSGFLKVSDIHDIYFEECGNPKGSPAVFLHGGPGGGFGERDRRFFDPEVYRVVLFDQRGAGKSKPAFELRENTTWDMVADIERLREHLNIDKWLVFGGSWGSTLSLAYAQTHPDRVKALVLRGIFTLRKSEITWYYQYGASHIFPDEWDRYLEPIPEDERDDLVQAYYKRLTGDDEKVRLHCARRWSGWEMATSRLLQDPNMLKRTEMDTWALQFARIECHYFINKGFFREDGQLLNDAHKIKHIPMTIVQGRYDVVCPATTAWELHKRLPDADFIMVADSGHSALETNTTKELIKATEKYKNL